MDNSLIATLIHYIGLPLLIFFARIMDVTLGTLRIIFISRGKKLFAPMLGFVETFIWIVIVSQIVRNIDNDLLSYLAYATGFATGTTVGMLIEDRLAIGKLILRTILPEKPAGLVANLRSAGYGVTCVAGEGANGPVTVMYTIIKRKALAEVSAIIHQAHPHAFLTIEELRSSEEGVFPQSQPHNRLIRIRNRK